MNIYYHPILGLQYAMIGSTFLIDVAVLPQDFDLERFREQWLEWRDTEGVSFYDSVESWIEITNIDLN
jgi:hypothetical protein